MGPFLAGYFGENKTTLNAQSDNVYGAGVYGKSVRLSFQSGRL